MANGTLEKCTSRIHLGFNCAGQLADSVRRCVGERLADVKVVNRVPHGGGGVVLWAAISYEHNCILLMAI